MNKAEVGDFVFRKISGRDAKCVVDIFNYYVENGFAAFPERPMPCQFFDTLMELSGGYPFYVIESPGGVIGFGLLYKFHPSGTFKHTAEVGYFIMPDYTGKGLGVRLLNMLLSDAKKLNVESVLAKVSSLNPESIKFHLKNGFRECGRLERIGRKNGRHFDVLWFQKFI